MNLSVNICKVFNRSKPNFFSRNSKANITIFLIVQYPTHFLLFPGYEMCGVSPPFANRIAKKPSHRKAHTQWSSTNIPSVSAPEPTENKKTPHRKQWSALLSFLWKDYFTSQENKPFQWSSGHSERSPGCATYRFHRWV